MVQNIFIHLPVDGFFVLLVLNLGQLRPQLSFCTGLYNVHTQVISGQWTLTYSPSTSCHSIIIASVLTNQMTTPVGLFLNLYSPPLTYVYALMLDYLDHCRKSWDKVSAPSFPFSKSFWLF